MKNVNMTLTSKYSIESLAPFFCSKFAEVPELIAVLNDLKPLLRICLDDYQTYLQLKEEIEKLGLKIGTSNYRYIFKSDYVSIQKNKIIELEAKEGLFNVYISKDEGLIERGREYGDLENTPNNFELGKLLGYPQCCIDSWVKMENDYDTIENSTLISYKNSLAPQKKIDSDFNKLEENSGLQKFSALLNNFFWNSDAHLINYMLCSYKCKKSKEYADKLLNIIKQKNNQYAEKIISYLKNPVLYIYPDEAYSLRATIRNNILYYNDYMPVSPVNLNCSERKFDKILKVSDSIEIMDDRFILYRGKEKIFTMDCLNHKPNLIINFHTT